MISANLIPTDRAAAKRRHAHLKVWITVCCVYAVILGGGLGLCHAMWGRHNFALTDQIESATTRITESELALRRLQRQLPRVQAALEASEAMGNQPDWSNLLVLLAAKLGDHVVLSNCQLSLADKSPPAGAGEPDAAGARAKDAPLGQRRYKLVLDGFGRTQTAVSQFVLRLELIDLFEQVKLTKSSRQPFLSGQAVAFSIECSI